MEFIQINSGNQFKSRRKIPLNNNQINMAVNEFDFIGEPVSCGPFGEGHINGTYCARFLQPDKTVKRYILQSINTVIFDNPAQLMSNIEMVTQHLKKKIIANGGNPDREALTVIKTKKGENLYKDEDGVYWRAYAFIEDTICYETAEKPVLFYNSAKAFGKFLLMLSDFPAEKLYETIPRFHDTLNRYNFFISSVEKDLVGRAKTVSTEIEFIKARKDECDIITQLMKEGKMPLRVVHNDTKLNNIMMDSETDEGVCVLDLDTVMPGCGLFDFGDSIRFGASNGTEDETDLSQVYINMELFEEYTKGFLSEASSALNQCELDNLAFASKIITLEQAIRFLGDYINGDVYYKVKYDTHNLDRARTQIKLVQDMESKMNQMNEIVKKYS